MQKLFEKTKPIGLLLALSAIAVGMVWIVNQLKETDTFHSDSSSDLAQAVSFVDETASVLTEENGVSPEKITEDNKPQVLAAAPGSSNQCAQALNQYNSIKICTTGGDGVDYTDGSSSGSYVRKNAKIKLASVQMPLVLMSGSKAVKDSNRKITSETGVYKPAGEQFTEEEEKRDKYPNEDASSYIESKPFSTRYSVAYEQAQDSADEGDIVVSKKIKNNCEYCNNKSNVNPDKTNKISEFLYNVRMKIPGGNEVDTSMDEEIQSCSKKDTFRQIDSEYEACRIGPVEGAIASLQQLMPSSILDTCKLGYSLDKDGRRVPPDDDCIRTEDIIIKISSMFGSETVCEKGVCTNAYMTARNKIAMAPTSASGYSDNVYYLTPCKAYVDGDLTDVRCAWDLSYLFKERKVEEFDDIGNEKTPSKSAYDEYLLEEAGSRNGETAIDMF